MKAIQNTFLLFALYGGLFLSAGVLADGALDTSFNPGSGISALYATYVYATAVQTDGKILVGGAFDYVNGVSRSRIARLNTNGSLDSSFTSTSSTGPNAPVKSIALQSDGKIIICGQFYKVGNTAMTGVARLNADGSLDSSFTSPNISGIPFNEVSTCALQSNGKLVIGGIFTSINGSTRNRIARLNADGTLDGAFNPGTGADSDVYALVVQGDGKIVIGGGFTTVNGIASNRLARLNTDGSLDGSFNPGSGASSSVYALALQADGKIIVGGQFATINGISRHQLARLHTSGLLDDTFIPGTGNTVYSVAMQADGKVVIGGIFTAINGTARNRVARLNADASLDATFDPVAGANKTVYALAVQADDKVVLGGAFTTINGTARSGIARLVAHDADSDGVLDATDNCPLAANANQLNTDGDAQGDACDADDDNDGVLDVDDAFPLDASESIDTDNDGIGNNADWDDDNDGVPDVVDAAPLNAADTSEVTLPINSVYKGALLQGSEAAQ